MALFGKGSVTVSTTPVPITPDLTVLCSKVTNPQAETENPNDIREFCDAVNQTIDGPQRVVRIVVPKIQSLNEREALYTLNLIDACVQSCGIAFHAEIGKFRFLNEIIKLLSPKYLGATTPERVKKRSIELLYGWSRGLTHEPKIKEAYEMLKQQGLITSDPTYVDHQYEFSSPKETKEKVKNPIFEDDEKNKLLTKLLQSKNKDDLEAANRLIKTMVKEDEEKLQKQYKRTEELDTIHNNIRLMNDMLNNYSKTSSDADIDLMKELKESLVKFRPRVFQLAAETDENDESIGDILLASDELSSLLERYNSTVGNSHYIPPDKPLSGTTNDLNSVGAAVGLLDLHSLDPLADPLLAQLGLASSVEKGSAAAAADTNPFAMFESLGTPNSTSLSVNLSTSPFNSTAQSRKPTTGGADLIGHTNPFAINSNPSSQNPSASPQHRLHAVSSGVAPPPLPNRPNSQSQEGTPDLSKNASKRPQASGMTKSGSGSGAFGELDSLAKNWLTGGASGDKVDSTQQSSNLNDIPDVPLIQEMVSPLIDTSPAKTTSHPTETTPKASRSRTHREDFTIYSIKPSPTLKPMSLISDSDIGISITANFTQFAKPSIETEQSKGLSDIVVLTISNTSSSNYSKVGLQVACPKSMRTQVGAPSSDSMPAQTPFAPPAVINQCLFIYNPTKVVPRLKLKVTMTKKGEGEESGEGEAINRVIDCSLDCLISEADLEFSDFS
ncbi:ADP-ribosylation factor-binding protein GGA1-like isoform X2 [Symsagittifera roscoffensis]|uniref:ADP-ribosylation factor-binding protein GGA1-like isoform X2 n=1 Tax=Symsagittifera roscoffensis TaxID=84072 RepID=UPI00307C6BFC